MLCSELRNRWENAYQNRWLDAYQKYLVNMWLDVTILIVSQTQILMAEVIPKFLNCEQGFFCKVPEWKLSIYEQFPCGSSCVSHTDNISGADKSCLPSVQLPGQGGLVAQCYPVRWHSSAAPADTAALHSSWHTTPQRSSVQSGHILRTQIQL